jgi:hypothetical protein
LLTTSSVNRDEGEAVEVTTFGAAKAGELASRTAVIENENALSSFLIFSPCEIPQMVWAFSLSNGK